MMLRNPTKMMSKNPYFYVIYLIATLELFTQCQCSTSANANANVNNNQMNKDRTKVVIVGASESRKLSDSVEPITTFTNLISDQENSDLVINHDQIITNNEFQYYNEPIELSTPKYDTISSHTYSNHRPIHQFDTINDSYFPELEQTAHLDYVPNSDYVAPIPPLQQQHLSSTPIQTIPNYNPNPTLNNHQLVKVTREPFWATDVIKLEDQYISTFRSIKTSVMSVFYRMQDFISYLMGFFSLGKFWFLF